MQELKNKVLELIDKYKDQLAAKGIKLLVSKRYVEKEVDERSSYYVDSGTAIFSIFERIHDRKKEKAKGYNFEKNKYHSIAIVVVPLDENLVSLEECREYAFVLNKTERAHIGIEPQRKTYQISKILDKIEKRILKILKIADKKALKQICKNTFWDAFRYAFFQKYAYKDKFYGKERYTWEMIFMVLAVAIVVAIFGIMWGIIKLF